MALSARDRNGLPIACANLKGEQHDVCTFALPERFAACQLGAFMPRSFLQRRVLKRSRSVLPGALWPAAYFGTTWHNGFKLYWDKLNAAGGVNGTTVAYEQEDDKADPREGTLVAQKFCDDDEVLIGLVNFNSGVAQSTLPIYEECSLPTMTFGSTRR